MRLPMASLAASDNGENSELPRACLAEAAESESHVRVMPREEKGGYECEFVKLPPEQLQSECSICLLVLREPHLISCCGHNICETCIGCIQRDGKPCPLCNEPGFTTMANKGLKRTLSEFQVRCPHRELGCEWVGELGKLDQHLNSDPQPERQLEGCQFASIECIHCKDHMRRHVIAGHQNEQCPKRPYICEHCEEYESTFEDVVDHWEECKCYLLPCPNNCNPSGSGIKRQNLEHHVKQECPLTVVECDFHYAGCGVKLPRKDMAVHMKEESMAHISLLAAKNQRLAKQLLERDEKMQQLMQQNTELSNRINQQEKANQELRKEMRDAMERVRQDLAGKMARTILPIDIKMSRFKKHRYKNIEWHSPPFYTHMCGYKMRLSCYANGYGDGEGTHISVFTCLMCGEFDSHLKWPFRGVITIQLLNQLEDREHYTKTIDYTDQLDDVIDIAGRLTDGMEAAEWGFQEFILHSKLNFNHAKNCHYLRDDSLVFRVLSVVMHE